ncbi:MerR family transcriptional regulator [Rhodococcus gannanensis]|uniref:MerR family transcriptional regulator n=1 Tax=Rhodococcus gannanensis TaxID=1960308 RepID=A0ABW4P7T2_9NOCA
MTDMTVDGPGASAYSLAELARAADVPARTIRYYQSEGLLPRPSRRAGQAVYDRLHLERLRSIGALQSRGLRLQTIREVLGESGESTSDVADLLGPEIAGAAWLATSARTLDEGELADLLGDAYPDQVGSLVSVGYLERRLGPDGRGVWYCASVPQLRGALELRTIGAALELSAWASNELRARLRDMSELFVGRWIAESGRLYRGTATREDFDAKLERLRAVAWQSAAHVMAEEMGRAIQRSDEIRERVVAGDFDFGAGLESAE